MISKNTNQHLRPTTGATEEVRNAIQKKSKLYGTRKYLFMMLLVSSVLFVSLLINKTVSQGQEVEGGILYPRDSETRQRIALDGLWDFVKANSSNPLQGFTEHWYQTNLRKVENVEVQHMPVPASYNDITIDGLLRDHVGLVWYEKTFFVSKLWSGVGRVWLRFGSVSYAAQVWLNGQLVMTHEIGHLPFQAEVTLLLNYGMENKITVVCDNTLLINTIPQGKVVELTSGRLSQTTTFDFFNYAGIDRSVLLYTTPFTYIDDITVATDKITDNKAVINYEVEFVGIQRDNVSLRVRLIDKTDQIVSCSNSANQPPGQLIVHNPNLWWPYLMHPDPGYLYTFQVELLDSIGQLVDKYNLPIGIRTLLWNSTSFLINNKPLYLHGFGRHEDSDIRGKGLDFPLIIRDYNLIKWIGANVYRTSHYPYAEEIMDLADSMGIMIIDECPAVNIENFSATLLEKHKRSLTETIRRDKNRPAVIMWSAANEPRTQFVAAKDYFKSVLDHIRSIDTSRPITIVEAQAAASVESSRFVDIVSFNRYNGWYINPGNLDEIYNAVIKEANSWHDKFQKPVIMQEYGADTLEGLHYLPEYIWSEEYQVELMSEHFKAFDTLKAQGFFIGEFIWNFADFKTAQTYTRVGGNKKGMFTRNRQPKASAHHLRKRYWKLALSLYNSTLPKDLYSYTVPNRQRQIHTEL